MHYDSCDECVLYPYAVAVPKLRYKRIINISTAKAGNILLDIMGMA